MDNVGIAQYIFWCSMTDEELILKTKAAREAAHNAPLNPYRLDADGHRWVEQYSNAWADRGNEFLKLAAECDKRGLKYA